MSHRGWTRVQHLVFSAGVGCVGGALLARDRLFPISMAERLARAAGERGELVVVQGMGHADLHSEARAGDWRPIVEWVGELMPETEKGEIKV